MERRTFVKNSGKLLAGAAAASVFGKLRAQDGSGPNNLCGPGCNLNGGQFQHLNPAVHAANATRSAAQCTAFKNGSLTNSYAAATVSGYVVPAVANLQTYGYCEQLRQMALNWVKEYNGGVVGPLTQAQINTMVAAGTSWGYTVTAAEANAMNALFNNPTVKANVISMLNTVGGFYDLMQFFESFNTWVNWQNPPAGPIGSLFIPPEFVADPTDNPDEIDYGLADVQASCAAFVALGAEIFAAGALFQVTDPAIAVPLESIGGFLYMEGAICDLGGVLTFGDSSGFVD